MLLWFLLVSNTFAIGFFTLPPCRRLCSNKTNVPADLQSAGNEYQNRRSAQLIF